MYIRMTWGCSRALRSHYLRTPVDSGYYPVPLPGSVSYSVTGGSNSGSMNGSVFTAKDAGNAEITAASGGASGSMTISVYDKVDSIALENAATGAAITSAAVKAGGEP